jgi:hypothetical protein
MAITSDGGKPVVAMERGVGGKPRAADYDTVQQAGGIDRSPECLENRSNRIKQMADYAFELLERPTQLVVAEEEEEEGRER